jgi:hypothetical protein
VRITQDSELEWEFEDEQSLGSPFRHRHDNGLYETSPSPVFRFTCTGGCHFGNQAQCRQVLRTAIRDAIALGSGAVTALEGTPSARTVRIFRDTFGHPPSRPVPWAGGRSSGATLARRYRLAINALLRGGTSYICDPTLPYNGWTDPDHPSRVLLGPTFWTQNRMDRGATILHEMMHQYYIEFIKHNAPGWTREHRRNNAHCLTNFALQIRGLTVPPLYLTSCTDRPV